MSGLKPSERAETGPLRANRGRHPAEPARPLMVQARESSPFSRKCRRITAQANTRPFPRSGRGGDEQDEAVRPGDRTSAARGSDAPDRRTRHHGRGTRESAELLRARGLDGNELQAILTLPAIDAVEHEQVTNRQGMPICTAAGCPKGRAQGCAR
jgi:hypothetical protein